MAAAAHELEGEDTVQHCIGSRRAGAPGAETSRPREFAFTEVDEDGKNVRAEVKLRVRPGENLTEFVTKRFQQRAPLCVIGNDDVEELWRESLPSGNYRLRFAAGKSSTQIDTYVRERLCGH